MASLDDTDAAVGLEHFFWLWQFGGGGVVVVVKGGGVGVCCGAAPELYSSGL
jgi:hypothetical protein